MIQITYAYVGGNVIYTVCNIKLNTNTSNTSISIQPLLIQ